MVEDMAADRGGARYALYWTPSPAHPLWAAGCAWLGRDAAGGTCGATPAPHTAAPRRYGFHATLKAPMRLRPEVEAQTLLDHAAALAWRTTAFDMPPLRVGWLSGFLALQPAAALAPGHPLRRLADACVMELDAWRAAPAAAELARRAAGLDEAQRARLQRWGYPHVLDGWRFHMTLSDTLPAPDPALEAAARAHFAATLARPLRCEDLSVFIEDSPGAPLRLLARLPLGG